MANLIGTSAPDFLLGTFEADLIQGLEEDDTLVGFQGDDTLGGNSENDSILGSRGNDLLQGGLGNDSLFGELDNDTLEGDQGDDLLFGNGGNDQISGGAGNDILYGGQGNDTLSNLEGDDNLFGDKGNDILETGLGLNILTGGAGSDLFVIGPGRNDGQTDIITDFRVGFDAIALSEDLEFTDLEFIQTGNDTTIRDRETGEDLTILEATQSNTLTSANFTKSIETITSVLQFSQSSIRVRENQTPASIEIAVERTGSPLNSVGVTISLPDEATNSGNLEIPAAGIPLVFAPFETFKRVTIPMIDDEVAGEDQSISLGLTDAIGGATIGGQAEFVVTVEDDDTVATPTPPLEPPLPELPAITPAPSSSTVALSVTPSGVDEDSGDSLVYTFTRSSETQNLSLAVNFSIGGSGILGSDYTQTGALTFDQTQGTVVFAPGSLSAQVEITPIGDNVFEPDQTVELRLNESGFLYGSDPTRQAAIGTIVDDDLPPDPPVYDFRQANFIGVEGDPDNPQQVEIIVSRSTELAQESRVDVILSDGTAVEGTDYTSPPSPTPLVFLPDETEKSVVVNLIPNTEEQSSRTVNLSFDNFEVVSADGVIAAGQAGVENPDAILTINDDDGPITYGFANPVFTTAEGNGIRTTEEVEIIRTGRVSLASSVTVNLDGVDAIANIDFVPGPITVNFAADQTSATVPIQIIGNVVPEPNQTIRLSLEATAGQNIDPDSGTANFIIVDDDGIPTYDFSASQYTASEDDGISNVVTVVRGGDVSEASSVDVILETGQTDGGTPGEDITPGVVTVSFEAGETSQTVELNITDDTIEEQAEAVNLRFDNFNPGGQSGITHPTANLLILDNDSPPVYNFSLPEFRTPEGDSENVSEVVEVLRSGDTRNASRVDVVLTQETAIPGNDFTPGPVSVNFVAGETSQFVPIEILGDERVESDETLELSFTNFIVIDDNEQELVIGRAGTLQPETTLVIENDDIPTVSITALEPNAIELDQNRSGQDPATQNGTFRIERSPEPAGELVVNLTIDGNKISPEDYELKVADENVAIVVDPETNTGTATITLPDGAANLDVTLTPIEDPQAEADESLTLTVLEGNDPLQPYAVDTENDAATVTILANDTVVTRPTDSDQTDEESYFNAVEGSLRQALLNAESFSGISTVFLDSTELLDQTINLVAALPNINNNINFDGPGASRLTIQRSEDATSNFRIFTINGGNVLFEGLTLANGVAPGTNLGNASSTVSGSRGGAMSITSTTSTVNIFNSIIENNAANNGGAIANSGTLNILNSSITGNEAVNGGAIVVIDGSVKVTNSTIAGNTADIGGGLFNSLAELTLTNSTVVRNTANSRGGGVRNIGGTVNLQNTLVAENTATTDQPDVSTPTDFPINTGGNNLIGDGTGANGLTNGVNGDILGTSDAPIDALLVAGFNTEGFTPTIALQAGSPAIDAGNNTFSDPFVDLSNPTELDQRQVDPFLRIINDVIDIGAFEFQEV